MRKVIEVGNKVAVLGKQASLLSDPDVDLLLDAVEQEVSPLLGRRIDVVGLVLDGVLTEMEMSDGLLAAGAIPTGFRDLDALTSGFKPGQFILIASEPSIGKTTLGLNLIRACSRVDGMPFAFFSLQLDAHDAVQRIMAAEARVPLAQLRSGRLSDEDWHRIANNVALTAAASERVIARSTLTIGEIERECRRLQRKGPLRVVVVDPIELIR